MPLEIRQLRQFSEVAAAGSICQVVRILSGADLFRTALALSRPKG
jgi:hypothetical protein